jgi:hypothetical protein
MLPVITKEQVLNEGIKIEVTQGDVIDMLVNEQVNAILAQKEALNQRTEELYLKLHEEDEKFKKLLKLPKGTVFQSWGTTNKYDEQLKTAEIHFIYEREDNKNSFRLDVQKKYTKNYGDCNLNVKVSLMHEGVEFTSTIATKLKLNFSKGLLDQISKHNQEILDFVIKFPKLNEAAVAKKIKSQFTKQIIKGSSKEFRQALEKSFGVSI